MRYLDGIIDPARNETDNEKRLIPMIRSNALIRFFKARGYRYVHMDSIWAATMTNPHADIEITSRRTYFKDEFSRNRAMAEQGRLYRSVGFYLQKNPGNAAANPEEFQNAAGHCAARRSRVEFGVDLSLQGRDKSQTFDLKRLLSAFKNHYDLIPYKENP